MIGEGETRQVQSLQAIDLKRAVPGTSPLKVMDKLPGVNFTSSDPFGAYEWSTRITVRGFNQNQLGFTLVAVNEDEFRLHGVEIDGRQLIVSTQSRGR